METRIGEIAKMMASEDKESGGCACLPSSAENKTPLQENIGSLGARIGVLAILICGVVFLIGLLIKTKDPEYPDNPSWIYMILIAVTLAVAAIPEGIPLCVTISLAIGCQEMVAKNVQVRKIAAVETLGSASVICSDKTGTLTEGKMTMTKMWSGGLEYNVTGQGFDPTKGAVFRAGVVAAPGSNSNRELGVRSTLLAALLCCDTQLFLEEDPSTGERTWQYRGNSSEAPIVVAARKVGLPEDIVSQYRRILTIPFSSSRKMMLTVTEVAGRSQLCEGGMALPPMTSSFTVCKGAPNWIIQNCSSILRADGSIDPLSEAEKQQINTQVVDAYSDLALRVLAVAVGCIQQPPLDLESEDISVDQKFEALKSGLTLCGMVASMDPDREGVQESVLAARGAGIHVVMITGDYLKTAIAIARWGLSDLDPQGSIVFCISESLGISCIKSMSWSEIEMLQLGTPAFHNTRGVLCWKRGTSETLHRQKLAPSRPRASLRTSHTLVIHSSWGGSDHIPTIGSDHIPMTFRPIFGCCGCATLLQHSIW